MTSFSRPRTISTSGGPDIAIGGKGRLLLLSAYLSDATSKKSMSLLPAEVLVLVSSTRAAFPRSTAFPALFFTPCKDPAFDHFVPHSFAQTLRSQYSTWAYSARQPASVYSACFSISFAWPCSYCFRLSFAHCTTGYDRSRLGSPSTTRSCLCRWCVIFCFFNALLSFLLL